MPKREMRNGCRLLIPLALSMITERKERKKRKKASFHHSAISC